MSARSRVAWLCLGAVLALAAGAWGASQESPGLSEPDNAARAVEVAPHTMPLTVAVLAFDSKDTTLGAQTAEVISARLSEDPALQLVERERLDQILNEQRLTLSAAVQPAEAARVGFLAGAKVLVVGRAYAIDEQMLITARTVGVETGRVYIAQVRGSVKDPLLPVLDELAQRVHRDILARRSQLVAPPVGADKEDLRRRLAERLRGKALPQVVVAVAETHYGQPSADPAAETELMLWLKDCGFTVFDPGELERGLRDWARDYYRYADRPIPRVLPAEVRVVVIGEAFSEPGGRFGDLVSGKCRLEVRALDRRDGRVIAIARRTTAAVDLSERIAGKKAIEEAAAGIAYEMIPQLAAYR